MLQFLDNLRARITNIGYGSQNRVISLVANWLANTTWLIESRFLNLAKETYSQNEVIYACLRLLSQSVPEAPLVPYADAEKKKALDAAHPLTLLIRRPNELMTEYEFWELTTLHMAIVGRSTWWKERNNAGQVIGLWPLRPDRVGPRYSDSDKEGERVLWGYNYQVPGSGVIVPIPRRDVIAFNFPDPAGESGGIVEGIGPVQALARQVASDNEATKFVGALLANYAAPTVVIKTKARAKNEEEANLIKSHFRSQFGGANRGVPALADGEAEIQVIGFNLRELEFPEIREIAESRICAACGTPAELVGVRVGLMRSTFNNKVEARRFFSETTLSNYWRRFQDQYSLDIATEFDESIVCEFDTSKVKAMAGVLLELAQPVVDAFKAGVAMVNEYRIALKQEPLDPEYGEVLYVPNTVTVVPVTDKAKQAVEKRQAALPKPPEVPLLEEPKENEEPEAAKSYSLKSAADPRDMAEKRMQQALEALFVKWAKEAAEKIKAGQALSDEDIAAELRWAIEPQLVEAATEEGMRIAAEIGVQFDPAIVNQEAVAWARSYSFDLVKGLTDTTHKVLQNAVSKYASTPGMTIGELGKLIEPAFGAARAEAIAQTEITRSYSESMRYYQEHLASEGVTMAREWLTNNDELTCFPAGVMVETIHGPKAIETIELGELILTRAGYRSAIATSKTAYRGEFVMICTTERSVIATDNHPFWVERGGLSGWLPARLVRRGDVLRQATADNLKRVDSLQFGLSDANNGQTVRSQEARLSGIALGVPVPVITVDLQSNPIAGQIEVNGITPYPHLLLKDKTQRGQRFPYRAFNACLVVGAAIAGKTAELTIAVTGQGTKLLAASSTVQDTRWAAAFLGAVVANHALIRCIKDLTATLADEVLCIRQPTLATANGVTVSNRGINSKGVLAHWAKFLSLGYGCPSTSTRTKLLTTSDAGRQQVESLAASQTHTILAFASTLRQFVLHPLRINRHNAPMMTKLRRLYHNKCAKGIFVYNLEVEDDHTFYANGLLVHNCPICRPLHKKPESEWSERYPSGPPAHVRCRCSVVLKAVP